MPVSPTPLEGRVGASVEGVISRSKVKVALPLPLVATRVYPPASVDVRLVMVRTLVMTWELSICSVT